MKRLSLVLVISGILVAAAPVPGQIHSAYTRKLLVDEWLGEQKGLVPAGNIENAVEEYRQLDNAFKQKSMDYTETYEEQTKVLEPYTTNNTEIENNTGGAPLEPPSLPSKPVEKASSKQEILGILTIEKIKVEVPIVEGIKPENLRIGVGHIPGTSELGEAGNTAIAGHRSHTFGRFFNRLDELEEGDQVVVTLKDNTYKYQIIEKIVVEPQDTWVLHGDREDNLITLITCHPLYIASHRLIVRGRLQND